MSFISISNCLSLDIERQLQEELGADGVFRGKIHYRWDSNAYYLNKKTFDIESGSLVLRGETEYDQLRLGYNGACRSLFPMAILRPETTEDVATGVKTANKLGMKGSRVFRIVWIIQ